MIVVRSAKGGLTLDAFGLDRDAELDGMSLVAMLNNETTMIEAAATPAAAPSCVLKRTAKTSTKT